MSKNYPNEANEEELSRPVERSETIQYICGTINVQNNELEITGSMARNIG